MGLLQATPAGLTTMADGQRSKPVESRNRRGAYAWITNVERGGTGAAWWSPSTGIRRVTGESTVIDTRSGAVAYLPEVATNADGGTIVLRLSRNMIDSRVGVTGTDGLPPLAC